MVDSFSRKPLLTPSGSAIMENRYFSTIVVNVCSAQQTSDAILVVVMAIVVLRGTTSDFIAR